MCELFDGLVKSFDQWKDLLSITFHVTELTVPEGFTLYAFPICIIGRHYSQDIKYMSGCQRNNVSILFKDRIVETLKKKSGSILIITTTEYNNFNCTVYHTLYITFVKIPYHINI